eukprot:g14159.t1
MCRVQPRTPLPDNLEEMPMMFEEMPLIMTPTTGAAPLPPHDSPTSSDLESLQAATNSDAGNPQPAVSVIILTITPAGHDHLGHDENTATNYPNPPTMNHIHNEPGGWVRQEQASAAATSEAEPAKPLRIFTAFLCSSSAATMWSELLPLVCTVLVGVFLLLYPIRCGFCNCEELVELAAGQKLQTHLHLLVVAGGTFLLVPFLGLWLCYFLGLCACSC